jgi:hypothetical protein
VSRQALFFDLLCNALLPWLGYEWLKRSWDFSDFRALLWVTLIPVLYGLVILLQQRRVSLVAGLSLFSLGLSLISAMLSHDVRMLQIRESFCTALFGLLFLLSVPLGKPLVWLIMREQAAPIQRQRLEGLLAHPQGRRFLNQLCCGVGCLMVAEFFLKWWMIEHLPIATVIWLGPLILKVLAVLLAVLAVLSARRLRSSLAGGMEQGSQPLSS